MDNEPERQIESLYKIYDILENHCYTEQCNIIRGLIGIFDLRGLDK